MKNNQFGQNIFQNPDAIPKSRKKHGNFEGKKT
jgi:hypothetical protein